MYIDHRYEVLESLGSGSWANVYKVKDIRTNKLYSLKLFQYLPSDELYRHFSAEDMHHITKIEHPNLLHVVDFGHVGDHVYFISEYFEGKTLNNFRFNKSRISQVYDIIVQICYALHSLHDQKILHRDIKLENVLFRTEGNQIQVKLIDYGFSKLEHNKDSQLVSGSLPYVAPEMYLGQPASKDTDFYALGVMLYRLTTGSFPFSIDQINALIQGGHQYFIPNFPSELNKNIPLELERLILRLLEHNPENRFQSCAEIIDYINRISGNDYPFSVSWSIVNTLKFNSYIVREKYSHQMLEFLTAINNSNGKILSLIGGDGLGKDSILSLFRYHLLGGEYFLYDYSCTRHDHEAFFALIKEYLQSLSEEEIQRYDSLKLISPKFRHYLFNSEQEARGVAQSMEDLRSDFSSAQELLVQLSQQKPIIFIIRNFQYVNRHTIDFLNYFSPTLVQNRIMVALSCTDFNKVSQINHTVLINIPFLSREESHNYINRLLPSPAPVSLCNALYLRSSGNPSFIREILIDLVQRKMIQPTDVDSYPKHLDDYQLPMRLLHSVYSRMSHLTSQNYANLQKLSVVQTPLTREMIMHILKLKDVELYNLLNDAIYNEILTKEGKYYTFSFIEAKARMFEESNVKVHVLISKRLIQYFQNKEVEDLITCQGLIDNSFMAEDLYSARHYYLKLYALLTDDYEQTRAYDAMLSVLKLDFDPRTQVSTTEIIKDLSYFQEKTEITGLYERAGFLLEASHEIPEIFEKYYTIGSIHLLRENHILALESFKLAEQLVVTGRQKLLIWLAYIQVFLKTDIEKAKYYIDRAMKEDATLDLKIAFIDRLAVYHNIQKDTNLAIKIIEDFFATLPSEHDDRVMYRLAALHNNLGVFYSDQKNIEEAEEHLGIALNIWKRYNIRRFLGLIYNNLADLYLKQGITVESHAYSRLAYEYADELNLTSIRALALLNQGEAKIKMGEFAEAEELLLDCEKLIKSVNSTNYLSPIQRNLALAKSKIQDFGHYYQFIKEQEPNLITGKLSEINPLVKTFFYYLAEMKNPKKLKKLLTSNTQINFKHIHEEEFYHNVLSMIALVEKDYERAHSELKTALRHAGAINNNYAIAVFYVMEVECHYGLKEYSKAREYAAKARELCEKYSYNYWQAKLDILELKLNLVSTESPLRESLRLAMHYQKKWAAEEYYQLNVELLQIRLQILIELKQEEAAERLYTEYQNYLMEITRDIPEDDRNNYLNVNQYQIKQIRKFAQVPILSREKNLRRKWNDLLFNIANLSNRERIMFLIEKAVKEVISPWRFRIWEYSSRIQHFSTFQSYNCDKESLIWPELLPEIERAFKNDNLVQIVFRGKNIVIIPFVMGLTRVGYMVISDSGELPFTRQEISIMRNIKQHLSALIVRLKDYSDITMRIEKMNQLMQISHELMRIVDIADLEQEIVSQALDFTNGGRGFLIKRDSDGNNIHRVQLSRDKQMLTSVAGISKSVLSLSQTEMEPISTYNAMEDSRFKSAISVQDYQLHTIFCAPIVVGENLFGFLYLDNMDNNSREMYLKPEIINLFIEQISIALKNAMLYDSILKKSKELNTLDQLKDEFMAIVSHEINTPLTTLQSYVSRLKRNLYVGEEERQEIVSKIETSVRKLIVTASDINTMNNYNLKKSLPMAPVDMAEILELVQQEVEILSRNRKMFFKIELERDLGKVKANWEALHLLIYNLVLNSIRFTNDFGTITIGARKAAFHQEKIDGKDSLVIFVQDNGIGIPEYQLKNVFRKFYELNEIYAHKSGTVEYRSSGLGLGLATSKRIVELHGGDIWIKSKENEGTTVFVTIPLK